MPICKPTLKALKNEGGAKRSTRALACPGLVSGQQGGPASIALSRTLTLVRIAPRRVLWRRVLDLNDRALRNVVVGLGGHKQGVPRETGFDIAAASEVMAMLCLAQDADDLRERLDRTLIGYTYRRQPVTAGRSLTSAWLWLRSSWTS